ncbi:MAG: tetratricopeptide repeat protein [Magnetococcales bacterium]|nr:tetratricopeptide repeat protein [Magnetococcales bacterium]
MDSLTELLHDALIFHQQGAWGEAEQRYQRILEQQPDHLDALNMLAGIYFQRQEYEQVLELTNRALLFHEDAMLYGNLGLVYYKLGNKQKAMDAYWKAIAFNPDYPNATINLSVALREQGEFQQAIQVCKEALKRKPDDVPLLHNLAHTQFLAGLYQESLVHYQKICQINPKMLDVQNSIGVILGKLGRNEESVSRFREILENKPGHLDACHNLSIALRSLGKWDEAIACCQEGLSFHPNDPTLLVQMGLLHLDLGMSIEGNAFIQKSHPSLPENQQPPIRHIGALLYDPEPGEEERFQLRLSHAARLAKPTSPPPPFKHDRFPDRILRVGYLSADFRFHPVGRNLLPVLESHDRRQVALFFYSNLAVPDEMTQKFVSIARGGSRRQPMGWRPIFGLSDDVVAKRIRDDRIDILVYLAGHFEGNRSSVCVHRPAPVQISWLDNATSALPEMDYFFTDRHCNPPRGRERFTERLVRLPSFITFPPLEQAPAVAVPPVVVHPQQGITFGSFNNPTKMNHQVLQLWATVLASLPKSRLMLGYQNRYQSRILREHVLTMMACQGVTGDRILFLEDFPGYIAHLDRYNQIDVTLDSFPFSGSNTTFESLWMGVPVVTLSGENMVSRVSTSMLIQCGLDHLIATSSEQFIYICHQLALSPESLIHLKSTLRERIARSSLCQFRQQARHLERVYRHVWKKWLSITSTLSH